MPKNYPAPGARIGCELYGEVLAIGPAARIRRPDIQLGDRVCGAIHGSNPIDHGSGSFCDFVSVPADLLEGTPTRPLSQTQPAPYVLVYGGSTATGTMALQLLKLSGYRPITTCSPHNFKLAKQNGAEATFDYHSESCAADIKAYTSGRLRYVLDVITDTTSQVICHAAFGRGGGIYAALESPLEALHTRPRTVKVDFVVGLCALGREIALSGDYKRAADPSSRLRAGQLFDEVQPLVEDGSIVPHPHRVIGKGYQSVLKGIRLLEQGVSGERLVVLIE
ncbi:hypothetical protein F4861DRAFT_533906 [Xylaria intraflava]|nr:hypothetical protein F4861DRAFT_533906 [Xylaria intraflava]